jgi:hypothetical protein
MTVTINGTTGVAGVDGTAATPAIQGNDTNTGIFFPAADTIAFAEGGAEVARFNSSGELLVGTTTNRASSKLNIFGDVMTLGSNATYYGTIEYSAGTGFMSLASENGGGIAFKSGTTERMRIDTTGNFLVGVTSSSSFGGGVMLLKASGTGNGGQVRVNKSDAGTATIFSGQYYGQVGSITMSDSALAFNTTSDYRLKDNITPMVGALDKVKQLNPVTYTWKRDNSTGQGFIAHEIQAIVPDCVTGEKDAIDAEGNPDFQQVDYSKLVATLTAAIQEQQAIITDLKSRIEALEQA